MLRLKAKNVDQALERCYRLMAPAAGGKGVSVVMGGGSRDARIDRQLDMILASRVIGFVDRKLRPECGQIVRFCFSSADCYSDYAALTHVAWGAVESGLAGRDLRVRDGVSSLRLLAPWEVRHRILNPGECKHSAARLSELLGVNRSSFCRSYQGSWDLMLMGLLDVWGVAVDALELQLNELVGEKFVEGKAIRINDLGLLSACFCDDYKKVA